ncbi:MAG TPA: hypothetical protein VKM35_05035 [Arenimonas sp.]|uniref:hypothetical protein n=1 Tax=Arenimonas sp. TaxID=1872635 RepID=UPI002C2DB684|nr:hypothetical protein [Arenimonas sp.]HMB56555.1 hypothetical protein [Arenimonas sp.]
MPRWLWIAIAATFLLLVWMSHGHKAPLPATAAAGGGPIACTLPPSFVTPDQPLQSPVDGRMSPVRMGNATITPLAGFSLEARVLSREDYSLGTETKYSPTDLALGWGPMANPQVSDRLDISQSGRWYHYRWGSDGPPIPLQQIIVSSANMHMIPADGGVADALSRVRQGDTVRVNGWLVRVDSDDNWHWQSSLTREDSGGGACEVIYLCSISSR